jgi:hypothetical protein
MYANICAASVERNPRRPTTTPPWPRASSSSWDAPSSLLIPAERRDRDERRERRAGGRPERLWRAGTRASGDGGRAERATTATGRAASAGALTDDKICVARSPLLEREYQMQIIKSQYGYCIHRLGGSLVFYCAYKWQRKKENH